MGLQPGRVGLQPRHTQGHTGSLPGNAARRHAAQPARLRLLPTPPLRLRAGRARQGGQVDAAGARAALHTQAQVAAARDLRHAARRVRVEAQAGARHVAPPVPYVSEAEARGQREGPALAVLRVVLGALPVAARPTQAAPDGRRCIGLLPESPHPPCGQKGAGRQVCGDSSLRRRPEPAGDSQERGSGDAEEDGDEEGAGRAGAGEAGDGAQGARAGARVAAPGAGARPDLERGGEEEDCRGAEQVRGDPAAARAAAAGGGRAARARRGRHAPVRGGHPARHPQGAAAREVHRGRQEGARRVRAEAAGAAEHRERQASEAQEGGGVQGDARARGAVVGGARQAGEAADAAAQADLRAAGEAVRGVRVDAGDHEQAGPGGRGARARPPARRRAGGAREDRGGEGAQGDAAARLPRRARHPGARQAGARARRRQARVGGGRAREDRHHQGRDRRQQVPRDQASRQHRLRPRAAGAAAHPGDAQDARALPHVAPRAADERRDDRAAAVVLTLEPSRPVDRVRRTGGVRLVVCGVVRGGRVCSVMGAGGGWRDIEGGSRCLIK
eukprot:scaffold36085_cov66-Phaeocystis_antarctica.AAC.2